MSVRALVHALRRNAGSEEGVALMEVVVSAAVLLLVVFGILAAMDAISGTAGANQARTVAAALAEEDQERLRALATEDLEQLEQAPPPPRSVQIGAVTYTVASKAQWITDAAGEEASCALDSGEGSYLRITSTVTSPITGEAVKPVVLTSIVAPRPGSGTLAALVKNASGEPISGLNVALSGPANAQKPTNDVGCAVFTGLGAGTYEVKLDQAPWIGEDGTQVAVKTATVTAGNVTVVELVYDQGSSLDVQVYTKINNVEFNDESTGVIAANGAMTAGFKQALPVTPPTDQSFQFPSLFPFSTPYTLYSGKCLNADPSKLIPTYFDDNPHLVVTLAPGVPGGTVRVLEPAVQVHATRSGTHRSNARVYAYPKPSECGDEVTLTTATNASGNLPTVTGLPFGEYDICAQYTNSSNRTFHAIVPFTNGDPDGSTVEVLIPNSPSTGNGGCP